MEKVDVDFKATASKYDNCICSCCHSIGRVVKINMPETLYHDGGRLTTRYTDVRNSNAYTMLAAPATVKVNTGVFACNTFGVSEITDPVTGCVRKIGTNTLGLAAPKDFPCTYTEIDFAANKKLYRFGLGNLSAAIGSNKFFTVANGLLVPAAAAPATNGAVYFELHDVGKFTVGAHAGFDYYDLMARSVTA